MSRDVITSGVGVTMTAIMANLAGHVDTFYDAAVFPLTAVGGTGNAVTASLAPALSGGLVLGMKHCLTWGSANTGAVTLAINGGAAVAVLDAAGGALTAGALAAGRRSLIEYDGAAWRVLTPLANTTGVTLAAMATFNGTTSPPTQLYGVGVTITGVRLGAGQYRFTLSSARPTTTYPVLANAGGIGGGSNNVLKCTAISPTQFEIDCWDSGGAVFEDAPILNIMIG